MNLQNVAISYSTTLLQLKKSHPDAKIPSQADGDVGFDVSCIDHVTLPPGKVTRVNTGLILAETPEPLVVENKIISRPFLKIEGRSGLASNGVFPVGGIVDPRYRGDIQVALFNSTDKEVLLAPGDRIAQLVVYYVLANTLPYHSVKFVEVDKVTQTDRGQKGFGSSGT